MKFDTKSLHAGYEPESDHGSRAVPIYQTVAHLFRDTDHAARLFLQEEEGHVYSRISNPTVEAFEKRMAELEGAGAGLAASSGMAAIFLLSVALAANGDEIVSSPMVYGGTYHLFNETLPRFGITTRFVENPSEAKQWAKLISPKTKFLFLETPANPTLGVFDIKAIADVAHTNNLPLVVDNTIATPALQQPFELGADYVVHSATKYISGSGTALGGIILGPKKTLGEMRGGLVYDIGASLAPFHAWLFLLGLETLGVRMKKHTENALQVARYLENHPQVSRVHYPGLFSSPYYEISQKQMTGASSLLGFELEGGVNTGKKFIENLKLISHVANLGDAKTLAIHPASTTHSKVPPEEQERAGISQSLVRMSVGLEDPEDIIEDISQSLDTTS